MFEDFILEEQCLSVSENDNVNSDLTNQLMSVLSNLTLKETSTGPKWNDIERRFVIDKFSGKENAADWLGSFETECSRHGVKDDHQRIKCLRLFLVDGALDWFKSNSIKLKDETWNVWSASFLKVYSDKGWAKIRFAYNYKYLAGSYVDFALRKERLILEVESRTSQYATINQIVIGLPVSIQEKLDRQELHTTDDLMNKLRQYESGIVKSVPKLEKSVTTTLVPKTKPDEKKPYSRDALKNFDRKPCSICESRGFPGRFHPPAVCRYREGRSGSLKINLTEDSELGPPEQQEAGN